MFIMNTKSTIAVMSNSGGSRCGWRRTRSSNPELPRPKRAASTASPHLAAGLEHVERTGQPGAERVLEAADAGRETCQQQVERDRRPQSHRRANQRDRDFVGD